MFTGDSTANFARGTIQSTRESRAAKRALGLALGASTTPKSCVRPSPTVRLKITGAFGHVWSQISRSPKYNVGHEERPKSMDLGRSYLCGVVFQPMSVLSRPDPFSAEGFSVRREIGGNPWISVDLRVANL